MIKAGIGQSESFDTHTAVNNAINQCRQQMAGDQPQAGIVFAGIHFDHRLMLDQIRDHFPAIDLIGCTTAGEFSSSQGFSDDSIILMVFYSDEVEIGIGIGRNVSKNPNPAIQNAVVQASDKFTKPVSICLTFPDWNAGLFNLIMKSLNQELGHNCPIFGGVAGTLDDNDQVPLQFFHNEVLSDAMPVMLFAGPLDYSFSIANSWTTVGKQATITSAKGSLVRRIDGLKAVDFYRYYLGDHSDPPREFLLSVYDQNSTQNYLRVPLAYHPDGSITFSESIPEGATIQLTEAIRDVMLEDTQTTSRKIVQETSAFVPAFAMAFSCAFRKNIFGTLVSQELQILRDQLPPHLPIVGFYSFGEIAPLAKGQESFFHGATLVTLLVGHRNRLEAIPDEVKAYRTPDDTDQPEYQASVKKLPLEHLKLENRLLKRKLTRSERYRERLEEIKDFNATLHRKIIQEVEEARNDIQRKEQLLRKSEEKYRRIVTTAGEGFILMDEDMKITDANEAFCDIVQCSKKEILGLTPYHFGADEFRQISNADQASTQGGAYIKFEDTLKRRDGGYTPSLVNASKLRDDSGMIIGNMAFITDLTEQKKALALAAEVQKSLLPQGGFHIPGLDIAGRNVSCDEIGGDYFDFLDQNDYPASPVSIVVGDIAGHGVDAALLMTTARAFLRMRAAQSGNISDIITAMNRHLTLDVLDTGRFMTLFYLAIDQYNKQLHWVRAGHDPAILYDPNRNTFEELAGAGIALGLSEEFRYEENRRQGIEEGQIIALGTDGIWETRNLDGIMFGKERFRNIIRGNAKENASDILSAVYEELDSFSKGHTPEDDITLVVAKIDQN